MALPTLPKLQTISGPMGRETLYWHTPLPRGQSVVERAPWTIKRVLHQQCGGIETSSPIERLCKALYVINFLNNSFVEPKLPMIRHFSNSIQAQLSEKLPVLIKDPKNQTNYRSFPINNLGEQVCLCVYNVRTNVDSWKNCETLHSVTRFYTYP